MLFKRKLEIKSNLQLIGSQESVYTKKIIKYKEISNYIKGEMLGKGSFGKVKKFIDKNSLNLMIT